MRAMTLAFGLGLILMIGPLSRLAEAGEVKPAPRWPITLWACLSAASVPAFFRFRASRARAVVTATGPAEAASRYSERLLLSIAFAEVSALTAFATFFLSKTVIPYLTSVPVSLVLIAWASPRKGDVDRLQRAITDRGSTVDLGAALMGRWTRHS